LLYRLVINPKQIDSNLIKLNDEQRHYLRRVVRLNDGDVFIAMDGMGNNWKVQLNMSNGLIVESLVENKELPIKISLMVALPKGNGFEDIVRCTTELGVHRIIPIISDRTLLKPSNNKLERWRKIVKEAAEQSERQIVPDIVSPLSVEEAFKSFEETNILKYIAFARSQTSHLQSYLEQDLSVCNPSDIVIATGCEGGWTEKELQIANQYKFQEVSLGKRILRAVTAPIMVMSVVASTLEVSIHTPLI
jgi:16S rRNA (uracil1498-N3)-methyltransferase